MNIITVDWDIKNGIETKIVKHPSGDVWHEGNVCSDFMNKNKRHPSSMYVMINEINWFKKYAEDSINVYDKWAGGSLSVKGYIDHLYLYVKEEERYS